MKWVLLAITLLAICLWLWGNHIDHSGRSADERLGAVVPWGIALTLVALDFALAVGWALWALFFQ